MSHQSSLGLILLSLRARWRRSWLPSLTLALLIGSISGFVFGAAMSARRVSSAYDSLLADVRSPDRVVVPGCPDGPDVITGCAVPVDQSEPDGLTARLREVPVVTQARPVGFVQPYLLDIGTAVPLLASETNPEGCYEGDRAVALLALGEGGPIAQALPFRLIGELPVSGSNGIVLTRATAERVGLAIGDEVVLAGWCGPDAEVERLASPLELVLTGVSIGTYDIEPPGTGMTVEPSYVDPTAMQTIVAAGARLSPAAAIWLDESRPPAEIAAQLDTFETVLDTPTHRARIDRSLDDDARLLWLLCVVGAITGVLLLTPILARSLRLNADDVSTVLALGGTRGQVTRTTAAHVAIIIAIATILATLIAPLLALWMPRGLADSIIAHRPLAFDGFVTAIGGAALIVVLAAMAAVPIWRSARPHPPAVPAPTPSGGSILGALRLGPAARTGVMAAYGKPAGRRLASPWPSLVSLCIAATVCVASLTYLAGLRRLEHSARLVGWNWDAAVIFVPGIPDAAALSAEIAAVDGVDGVVRGTLYPPVFLNVPEHELAVWPWSFATGLDAVRPAMLTGRAPDGPDEVAIDPVFRAETGLEVGDAVTLARPPLSDQVFDELESLMSDWGLSGSEMVRPASTPIVQSFEITGIAVLPLERARSVAQASFTLGGLAAFVEPSNSEIEATRAALPPDLPAPARDEIDRMLATLDIEDDGVYLRITGDVLAAADRIADLDYVDQVLAPRSESVLTEFVGLNVSRNDQVPVALVWVAAVAAAILLAYLVASGARARRAELAVLRTLGVTSAGIRVSIIAQAAAIAVIVVATSVPVGVLMGRWSWAGYANGLDVLPEPVVAWRGLGILCVSAAAAVVAVAAVLTSINGRRSLAADLRAE